MGTSAPSNSPHDSAALLERWRSGMTERILWRIGGGRELALGERPLLMGVVNATPDSFSDGNQPLDLEFRVARARAQVAAGAQIIDVGGESGVTNRSAIDADEEIARVLPLVELLVADGMVVSIDTYKPAVADVALAAGAAIVNDVSGLGDPQLADVCARAGAGLVLTHTRTAPKTRLDVEYPDGVMTDIVRLLRERADVARARGVPAGAIVLDPGPDLAKTPAQTLAALADLAPLHALGYPLLMATSRKDFLGALTGRPPRERLAGSLAALAHCTDQGAQIFRVHDVAAATEFLAVRAALRGEVEIDPDLATPEELRRDAPREPAGRAPAEHPRREPRPGEGSRSGP